MTHTKYYLEKSLPVCILYLIVNSLKILISLKQLSKKMFLNLNLVILLKLSTFCYVIGFSIVHVNVINSLPAMILKGVTT